MINDVGKTTAIIRLNDYVINMVNSTVDDSMIGGISIYDEDGLSLRYRMTINSDALNCRCLMYARSFSGDAIDTKFRPVLYLPSSVKDIGTGGVPCIPLYECISPSAAMLINGNYQITWWSNTDSSPAADASGRYLYDYSIIHKFRTESLGDVEDNASACKILCTAPVHWERLKLEKFDDFPQNTPVIRDVAILAAVSGEGYIVDFSTGSGSGMKLHSHLNTLDGGFAGAVFMPSAVPRTMSWS